MIPAAFDYELAESLDHARELLGSREDAKLLAGGHSLLPAMRLRIARPSLLVDIGRLAELRYVREDGDRIAIGALTRHADLAKGELLGGACPLVAHGDPAGDMPSVLLALDAEFVAKGPGGERTIAAGEFFTSLFETALAADEVLTEIRVPKAGGGWSYQKFNRRAQDWALVGVSAVRMNGGVHVGLTNMGLTPLRASGVEEAVGGGADPASAAARADEGTAPPSDAFASADYRRELVKVLVRRALEEALA